MEPDQFWNTGRQHAAIAVTLYAGRDRHVTHSFRPKDSTQSLHTTLLAKLEAAYGPGPLAGYELLPRADFLASQKHTLSPKARERALALAKGKAVPTDSRLSLLDAGLAEDRRVTLQAVPVKGFPAAAGGGGRGVGVEIEVDDDEGTGEAGETLPPGSMVPAQQQDRGAAAVVGEAPEREGGAAAYESALLLLRSAMQAGRSLNGTSLVPSSARLLGELRFARHQAREVTQGGECGRVVMSCCCAGMPIHTVEQFFQAVDSGAHPARQRTLPHWPRCLRRPR